MTKNEYNGWTNYETWVVKLWMDNEESTYNYWREETKRLWDDAAEDRVYPQETRKQAATRLLADTLKDNHEEALPGLQGFAADLLNAAMSEVNWYEIAENLLADAEEMAEADGD